MPALQLDLALAALEAGRVELAKKHAGEALRNNTDRKDWNHGNVVHNANQILGRCALREKKLADAKDHLLQAGRTPGSPQLNSFGPQMQLARELLEKGEKETVLEYLDLVGKFWTPDEKRAAELAEWKKEVAAGKIPTADRWR